MSIEVENLTVVLGERAAVDGIDLEVAEGEWLAVIGPNGAGKTTLLRALAGLVPFSGRIALDGRDAWALHRTELSRLVAVVPQDPSTPPWMERALSASPARRVRRARVRPRSSRRRRRRGSPPRSGSR